MKFDFHLHSYYSDGKDAPSQIVEDCQRLGLEFISLTDHENTDGIPEAMEAGKKLGIEVISGIEFAANYAGEEHHILGYFVDYRSDRLKSFLGKWRKTGIIQIRKTLRNLERFEFKISLEEVLSQARGSVSGLHVTWAVLKKPENSAILGKFGVKEERAFFQKFILNPPLGEGLAHAPRKLPKIQEVINLVQEVGGMAFLAHPFWRIRNTSEVMKRIQYFRKIGLDGIEVLYPFHNQEQALVLHQIARDLSMFESGGSDFHWKTDGVDVKKRKIAGFQTFGIEINFPINKTRDKTKERE